MVSMERFSTLLFLLMLIQVQAANSSETCAWKRRGYTSGQNCYDETLSCANVTAEALAQYHSTPQKLKNYYDICVALYVTYSNLTFVDSRIFAVNSSRVKLYEIHLVGDNIRTIAGDAFSNFPDVRKIDLQYNDIATINFLNNLNSLRELKLNNNNITGIEANNTFVATNNLAFLALGNNKIENIDSHTFLPLVNLKVLKLDGNYLTNIAADTFKGLANLERLNLANNKLTVLSFGSFAELTNLQHLQLSYNLIKELPLGVFANFPRLDNLQLDNNYLLQLKTGIFSNLDQLHYLNISYNNFSTLNVSVLYQLKNLRVLDLDHNNISYLNYLPLLIHLPHLHYISVNDNQWACRFLANMLKTFRIKGVHYLFNATSKYIEGHVEGMREGIPCTESPQEGNQDDLKFIGEKLSSITAMLDRASANFSSLSSPEVDYFRNLTNATKRVFDTSLNSINSIKEDLDVLSNNLTQYVESSGKNPYSELSNLANNISALHTMLQKLSRMENNTAKIVNDYNLKTVSSSNLGLVVLIVFVLILSVITSASLSFIVYKICLQKFKKRRLEQARSEEEEEAIN